VSASDSSDGGRAAAIGQLVGLVTEYGSLPRAVFALITLYILNGLFAIVDVIAGSVLFGFDLVVGSLQAAQTLLVGAFGAVGIDILGALVGVQQAIAGVVASAGPLAPVLAVGSASLLIYAMYVFGRRLVVGLLGELPGGSTLLELFGVD
jgi:hypothetical protein